MKKSAKLLLAAPEKIEKMFRRADLRVKTPEFLNVKVMFWHRGYADDSEIVPAEDYWQGKLGDLSLGGARIYVDREQESNLRVDQLVGLQFTPMPYHQPILLEGHIKHLTQTDDQTLCLGIHFLGLEISSKGREKLGKLVEAVSQYHKANQQNGDSDDTIEDTAASFVKKEPAK